MSIVGQSLTCALYQQPDGSASEGVLWNKVGGDIVYPSPVTPGSTNLVMTIPGGPISLSEGYIYLLYGRSDNMPAAFSVSTYSTPRNQLLNDNVPPGLRVTIGYEGTSSLGGAPATISPANWTPTSVLGEDILPVIRFDLAPI